MTAKIRKTSVVVQSRCLLQLVKHGDKSLRLETGLGQHTQTDAVGFTLHVTREVQLALHCKGLAAGDYRVSRFRALAGGERAKNHGADQQRSLPVLLGHHARDMALSHMAELVRQNRSQFILVRRHAKQAQVQTEPAPRQRESVDGPVLAEQHLPGKTFIQFGCEIAALASGRQQRLPDALHVLNQQWIVDVIGIAEQLASDALSQLALGADIHVARVAQGRQLRRYRHGKAHQHDDQQRSALSAKERRWSSRGD